jgi:predicted DNA-binding transcriptional regulator YafY
MNKAEAVLLLYDKFRDDRAVVKADFMALTGITDLTFRRYVAELRCYLMEWRPYEEIVYRKGDGVYFLKEAG